MQEPKTDQTTLEVKAELCLGCGTCAQVCARQAIWFMWGRANINRTRCDLCYRCLAECPEGAIEEKTFLSAKHGPQREAEESGHRKVSTGIHDGFQFEFRTLPNSLRRFL
jgi:ferredoxin